MIISHCFLIEYQNMYNWAKRLSFCSQKTPPTQQKFTVVFLRHGESIWNKEKRFTGWTDIPLTNTGIQESLRAGRVLREAGFSFDLCFTSMLNRAVTTFNYAAEELDLHYIPVVKSWKLNERHYGALQGLSKVETVEKHGKETVHKWRRSFDIPPPMVELNDPRHPSQESKYRNIPVQELPRGESLKMTIARVAPYWESCIVPEVRKGKRVFVVAHENSLRGIVQYLDNIPHNEISDLDIPTGIPLVYEFNEKMEKTSHYYLSEPGELESQINKVKTQASGE